MAVITGSVILGAAIKGIVGAVVAWSAKKVIENGLENKVDNQTGSSKNWFNIGLAGIKGYFDTTILGKFINIFKNLNDNKENENITDVPKEDEENTIPKPGEGIQTPSTGGNSGGNGNIVDGLPNITDKTEEGVDTSITQSTLDQFQSIIKQNQEWQMEQQRHIEERQDSAYQRAVEDLRKSGINANLLGSITPAESDAGITALMNNSSDELIAQMETYSNELMQLIEQNWKGSENDLNRFTDILGKWGQSILFSYLSGQIGKK